jgi:hypothetical protein
VNHQKPFVDQVQASGATPIRRAVPMPPGNMPPRNMSASVFNLNQNGYHPQPGFQQQPTWGMNPMNQVGEWKSINAFNGSMKLRLAGTFYGATKHDGKSMGNDTSGL